MEARVRGLCAARISPGIRSARPVLGAAPMHARASFALLPLLSVLAASSARAESYVEPMATPPPPPPPPAAPPAPHHAVSLTFSPIHLLFPIVEVAGEVALSEKVSVAGIVGFGSIPVTKTLASSTTQDVSETEHYSAWEVGGHLNYYVVGSFEHGMQLGVEALYLKISTPDRSYRSAASASGLALGPYVGYKLITGVGFTFEANLGAEYVVAQASSTDGSSSASASKWIPLLNLNIGWSF